LLGAHHVAPLHRPRAQPSVEDPQLWEAYDAARAKLFAAPQKKTGKPASRYGIVKLCCAAIILFV
jgi:hypothetical protein